MNIIIKETGEENTLVATNGALGGNRALDVIGNQGAIGTQFFWNEEKGANIVSQDDLDWWVEYLEDEWVLDVECLPRG